MVKYLLLLSLFFSYGCASEKNYYNYYANKNLGSKFLKIDNLKVHYREIGTGDTIVLLHGICDSLHTWRYWKNQLVQQGFHVITVDIPGFGLTGKWNKAYTIENYTIFLKEFLDKLEIKKTHIIGNSLGGYLAWNFASSHPERVNKLGLISPAAYPLDPPFVVKMASNSFTRWLSKTFNNRAISDHLAESVFNKPEKMSEWDKERFYRLFNLEGNHDAYMGVFQNILEIAEHEPNLTLLKTPTLLLWGEKDAWIPHNQAKLWERDVKNLKLISYKDVGHVPQLEIPNKSLNDVIHFLKTE
ncbi:hypothetical protein A9Q84_06095 [Halobacteriovorax marinus]|mgnify:CR=1 FL=1|uniref:AB hydrolase-1 domain-containing protein n=1 Tax=Halobacteriovorax marinus TaxID=97084 RepID=A0A1Y5F9A4_9BACT|nr:hypothetical protein A9Q84_06095 [Halobacteriovorax marinus]